MNFEKCHKQCIVYPVQTWTNETFKKYPKLPNAIHRTNFFEKIYTIDPEGCHDADDGFSIYYKNDKLFLSIHIADPTQHFTIRNEQNSLFQQIKKRGMTYYPSGYKKEPLHMLPNQILQQSSLYTEKEFDFKFTISITTEIDQQTFLPIHFSEESLNFYIVEIRPENRYTYKQASQSDIFEIGLKISKKMRENRIDSIKIENKFGLKYISEEYIQIYNYTQQEIEMKQMIEEFAIFSNIYIGEYFKYYAKLLNFHGIFRNCDASSFVQKYKNSNDDLYKQLIINSISAGYTDEFKTHDMISCEKLYVHFTSPIRRFSDCLCHFLLKYIHLKKRGSNISLPFMEGEFKNLIKDIHNKTKISKKISLTDQKFRKIQTIYYLLRNYSSLILECEVMSWKSGFLNIFIRNIVECFTYRRYYINISCSFWKDKNVDISNFKIKITKMNLYFQDNNVYIPFTTSGKMKDNEIFPELYSKILEL